MGQSTNPSKSGPADRLLRSADRLFYEKGYAATGINELIKDAGVAKASFYQHFPSKTDLVVAYLRNRNDAWFRGLTEIVDRQSEPHRRLLAVFDYVAEALSTNGFRGCAFVNTVSEFSDPESAPRKVVAEHKQEMQETLADLCSQAGLAPDAEEVFLVLEGAISQAAVANDSRPVHAARKLVQRRLEEGRDCH